MKVTQRVINIANQIAKNNTRRKKLNVQLNNELQKLGIDYQDDTFEYALSFLDCDSDVQFFVKYLESGCDIHFFDRLEFDL